MKVVNLIKILRMKIHHYMSTNIIIIIDHNHKLCLNHLAILPYFTFPIFSIITLFKLKAYIGFVMVLCYLERIVAIVIRA